MPDRSRYTRRNMDPYNREQMHVATVLCHRAMRRLLEIRRAYESPDYKRISAIHQQLVTAEVEIYRLTGITPLQRYYR